MSFTTSTSKFIKHLTTGNDNQTYDVKAIILIILSIGLLFGACIVAYYSHEFSPIQFGSGGAALLGGYGAGRLMDKDDTESEDLLKAGKEKP